MHTVAGLCDDHRSSMYEMLGIGRKGKFFSVVHYEWHTDYFCHEMNLVIRLMADIYTYHMTHRVLVPSIVIIIPLHE